MSDRDVIIRAENLGKTYRLYAKPHYRFLDMFGLLRKAGAYTEHAALRGVSLQIRRGEKVAFIGRNGAGKSTLLKLITGVIQPSAGSLRVSQGAHALLQIGSGFHQDFTGRQNALAYLAHLGVSGADAERRLLQIVDFAELESYIDQPIKTYSTGMVARLMFATSTVIEPELLVLDEILGVGDAYFAQKSFERIREMCEANGTTVLLVSHDIYSAAKLCDRMVWIDQGQMVFDGPSKEAIKAYEMSIRDQEEKRLRAKKIAQDSTPYQELAVIELASAVPLEAPIEFLDMVVEVSGASLEVPLSMKEAFAPNQSAYLLADASNWGDVRETEHGLARQMQTFGSPYNKVAVGVRLDVAAMQPLEPPLLKCRLKSTASAQLRVTWFDGRHTPLWAGQLTINADDSIQSHDVPLVAHQVTDAVMVDRAIGTHRIAIVDAHFVDDAGEEIFFLQHGASARLLIDYRINDAGLLERPQVVVAVHKEGAVDVCRFICRDLLLDGRCPTGTIQFDLERMVLSTGRYTVTVLMAREGYYDETQTLYFSINPGVYACSSRHLEFEVTGGGVLAAGTVFVGDAQWVLQETVTD
jgi:ABC-type polysaccharide/polyol phosphate transport system ATPase subunit